MNAKYLTLIFLLVFGLFFWTIKGFPPFGNTASIKDVEKSLLECKNIPSTIAVWNNKDYQKIKQEKDSTIFYNMIAQKLQSFNLTYLHIQKIRDSGFPAKSTNINIIIIPDFSNRFSDLKGNQTKEAIIQNDINILNLIWTTFSNYILRNKIVNESNPQDRLIIDITDKEGDIAKQFQEISDSLRFDAAQLKKGKRQVEERFKKNINEMYDLYSTLTKKEYLGADYIHYVTNDQYLCNYIKNNTVTQDFFNKIIIITDGYLEITGDEKNYTPIKDLELSFSDIPNYENIRDFINESIIENIQPISMKAGVDYSAINKQFTTANVDILVCEVNIRNTHKKIKGAETMLNVYWNEWFKNLGSKKDILFLTTEARAKEDRIKKFILNIN